MLWKRAYQVHSHGWSPHAHNLGGWPSSYWIFAAASK